MADKDIKDYCKNCDVEPPAMRIKCPECKHNPDNENLAKDINVPSEEQEREELKEKLRELELKNTILQNRNRQLDGSMVELACKTAECEELKEEIEALEKINRRNDQELLRRLTYASNAERQRDRYRRALKEIEEYSNTYF